MKTVWREIALVIGSGALIGGILCDSRPGLRKGTCLPKKPPLPS